MTVVSIYHAKPLRFTKF